MFVGDRPAACFVVFVLGSCAPAPPCSTSPGCADAGADADAGSLDAGSAAYDVVAPIPDAACALLDALGAPVLEVRPLAPIFVDGSAWPAPTSGSAVATIRWSLVRAPAHSRAAPAALEGLRVGLASSGTPGVDLAGAYVVEATVIDEAGAAAVHACAFFMRARGLLVELVWDAPDGDVDLHLMKRGDEGSFCANGTQEAPLGPLASDCENLFTDCNFSTCKDTVGAGPVWDDDPARFSAGDPRLLIDDFSGFGPEIIEIEELGPGDYLAAAYFYVGDRAVPVTVRVYVDGVLRVEAQRAMLEDTWFEAAAFRILGDGQACVADPTQPLDEVCLPRCADDACAQCLEGVCGPNVACHAPSTTCGLPASPCAADVDCGELSCIPATDACGFAECGGTCSDAQLTCDAQTLQCIRTSPAPSDAGVDGGA